jgi:hypothetical protein
MGLLCCIYSLSFFPFSIVGNEPFNCLGYSCQNPSYAWLITKKPLASEQTALMAAWMFLDALWSLWEHISSCRGPLQPAVAKKKKTGHYFRRPCSSHDHSRKPGPAMEDITPWQASVNSRWSCSTGSHPHSCWGWETLFPVVQQKTQDWYNVRPVIGPYVRPVTGETRSCAVTDANYKAAFTPHPRSSPFWLYNSAVWLTCQVSQETLSCAASLILYSVQ